MRRPRPEQPLAEFLECARARALRAQGFATSDVIMAWPKSSASGSRRSPSPEDRVEAQGPDADPEARPEPAVLVVRVESAFASRCSTLRRWSIDRVNTYYGWRCIGRIVLKQGPVRRPREEAPGPSVLERGGSAEGRRAVEPIEEDGLEAGPRPARPGHRRRRGRHESVTKAALATIRHSLYRRTESPQEPLTMITRRQALQLLGTASARPSS